MNVKKLKTIPLLFLLLPFLTIAQLPDPAKYYGGNNDGFSFDYGSTESNITIIKPNGGENLFGATFCIISWTAPGGLDIFKLEYSTNNGGSWNDIAEVAGYVTQYLWQVPNLSTTQGLVRVSNTTSGLSDVSDANFTITQINLAKFYGGNNDGFDNAFGSSNIAKFYGGNNDGFAVTDGVWDGSFDPIRLKLKVYLQGAYR